MRVQYAETRPSMAPLCGSLSKGRTGNRPLANSAIYRVTLLSPRDRGMLILTRALRYNGPHVLVPEAGAVSSVSILRGILLLISRLVHSTIISFLLD